MVQHGSSSSSLSSSVETEKGNEEQEQVIVARLLASLKPSELKNSNRSDWQQGQHRFIPVSNQLTETTPSLYTTQCRYWEGDNFSPKVSLYQLSQQEHLLLLQNHLLTFHVPPATPNPQILPYMHPILPQESSLFVPMREKQTIPVRPLVTIAMSAPSLYFSNHVVPDPIHGKSMVTIQEVQEEKIEESSNLMVSENSVQGSLNAEPKFKDLVHEEDNHKSIEQKIKVENVQGGENRAGSSERASDGSEQAANNLVDFQGQNSSTVGFLPGPLNPPRSSLPCNYRPPVAVPRMIRNAESTPSVTPHIIPNVGPVSSVLKPPRMRTGIPPYRARLESQRMDMGVVRPRFMAPAVCIRSVVPVCSAPPPRKISNSSQELVLPNTDQKDTIPQDL
ncbi:hypothetical protein K2173_022181 [Erythroxylum novogranatense]|uniref:Uncharacterized protein n=1 Tax=Erythroxylum novogranatense TaxID=1862640 RepID=A0AAV8TVN2_9ROSI|nr:hypothetical protein K2173_022181 [Erythroxylum novogranatense]